MFSGGGLPFPQPNGVSRNGEGQSYSIWGLPQPLGQAVLQGGGPVAQPGGVWTGGPLQPKVSASRGLPPPPSVPAVPEPAVQAAPTVALVARAEPDSDGATQFVVRCRGLPFSATADAVANFFEPLEIVEDGVHMKTNAEGLPCGECFVQFATEEALTAALERNRQVMGHRYVLLEHSSAAELAKACGPPPAPAISSTAGVAAAPGSGLLAPSVAPPLSPRANGAVGSGSGKQGRNANGSSEIRGGHTSGTNTSGGVNAAEAASTGAHGANGGSSGSVVIKMRGLPYSAAESEIINFFSGMRIASGGVSIGRDASGRASGEAHVEFVSEQDAQGAMTLNRQRIGSRYIELFRTKQLPSASRRSASAAAETGGGASETLRLRGMPFHSTEADVSTFFKGYSIASGGIKLGPQGGHGTVRFSSTEEARRALLNLNHSYMGNRYIELFSS